MSEKEGVGKRVSRTCTVIVNYQTPDLLDVAVRSFKKFYPSQHVIIVDNGSQDESRQVIEKVQAEFNEITSIILDSNLGHGPAMDKAIESSDYDYYFFLDSDTETLLGGFFEKMLEAFDDPQIYGVGKVFNFNRRGYEDPSGRPVLIAAYMLLRKDYYQTLPPFEHHGAPVIANFHAASDHGYRFLDFPIDTYIDHLHRGTVSRFGYGLGIKGKINHLLNKLGL